MTSTAARRAALATSAAALALATACGGSSGDSGSSGADEASSSAPAAENSAPAGKALTAAELEKVALAPADVKNGKLETKVPAKDDLAADQVSTDNEACLPLAYAQLAVAQGEAAAQVKRSWTGRSEPPVKGKDADGQDMADFDLNKVMLNIASYDNGGAEQALAGLKAALDKCSGGFTVTAQGEKLRTVEVSADDAPEGGDEGFAATLDVDAEGSTAPMKIIVVRKGSTVASFSAISALTALTGQDFEVPKSVVDGQIAKLG